MMTVRLVFIAALTIPETDGQLGATSRTGIKEFGKPELII